MLKGGLAPMRLVKKVVVVVGVGATSLPLRGNGDPKNSEMGKNKLSFHLSWIYMLCR